MESLQLNFVVTSNMSPFIAEVRQATTAVAQFQKANIGNTSEMSKMASAYDHFNKTLVNSGQFHSQVVNIRSEADRLGSSLSQGKLHWQEALKHVRQYRSEMGAINQLAKEQVRQTQGFVSGASRNDKGGTTARVVTPAELQNVGSLATRTQVATEKLRGLHEVVKQGANDFVNLGKNTQWAGRQMMVGLSLPIGMAVGMATKAFIDMDKELVRIQKVYGAGLNQNADDFKKQGEAIRKDAMDTASALASAWGQSSATTLKLEGDLAAVGKTGKDLQGSVKEMSRLSILGEIDPNAAMKAGLSLQTAFKQNNKELAESIDFMNAVENQTSTSMNDLVEAIPRAGATIKNLGGGIQELSLYMTAMREGGVSAGEGANALKSGLASVIAPADGVVKKLDALGINIKGIVNQNAGDLTKTLMQLGTELNKLDPVQKTQAMKELFGKFQMNKMAAMLSNLGKEGSQTLKVLELIGKTPAELAKNSEVEMQAVTESASGKFKRMMESMKTNMAILGKDFAGPLTKIVGAITGLVQAFNGLPDITKKFIEWGVILAALVGPIVMVAGVFMNFIGTVIKGATLFGAIFRKGLRGGWKEASADLSGAQAMANGLIQPFEKAATATEVLAGAVEVLIKQLTELKTVGALGPNVQAVTAAAEGFSGKGTGQHVESQAANGATAHRDGQSWTVEQMTTQQYGPNDAEGKHQAARRLAVMQVTQEEQKARRLPGHLAAVAAYNATDGREGVKNKEEYSKLAQKSQQDLHNADGSINKEVEKAREAINHWTSEWLKDTRVVARLTRATEEAEKDMEAYAQKVLTEGAALGTIKNGGTASINRTLTSAAVSAASTIDEDQQRRLPPGARTVNLDRIPAVAPTDVERGPTISFFGAKDQKGNWRGAQAGHGIADTDLETIGKAGRPEATAQEKGAAQEIFQRIGLTSEKVIAALTGVADTADAVDAAQAELAVAEEELAAEQHKRRRPTSADLMSGTDNLYERDQQNNLQLHKKVRENLQRMVDSGQISAKASADISAALVAEGKKLEEQALARPGPVKGMSPVKDTTNHSKIAEEAIAKSEGELVKTTKKEEEISGVTARLRKKVEDLVMKALGAEQELAKTIEQEAREEKEAAAAARKERRRGRMNMASGVAGGLGMATMMLPASEGTSAKATALSIAGAGGMGAMVGQMLPIPGGAAIGAIAGIGVEAINKLMEAADRASKAILTMSEAFNKATQGFSAEAIAAAGGEAISNAAMTLDDAAKTTIGAATASIADSTAAALGMTSAKIAVSGDKFGDAIKSAQANSSLGENVGSGSKQGVNLWTAGATGTSGASSLHENVTPSRSSLGEHIGSGTVHELGSTSKPSSSNATTPLWSAGSAAGVADLDKAKTDLASAISGAVGSASADAVSKVTTGVAIGTNSGQNKGFSAVASGIAQVPKELYHNLTQEYVEKYGKEQVAALKVLDNSRALDAAETMYMQLVNNKVPSQKAKAIIDEMAFQAGHADIKMKLKVLPEGGNTWKSFLDQGSRNFTKMTKDAAKVLGKDMEAAYREAGKQYGMRASEALTAGLKDGGVDSTKFAETMKSSLEMGSSHVKMQAGNDMNWGDLGMFTNPLISSLTHNDMGQKFGGNDMNTMASALGLAPTDKLSKFKERYIASSNEVRAQILENVSDKMKGSLKGLEAESDEIAKAFLSKLPPEVQALADSLKNFGDGLTVSASATLAYASAYNEQFQASMDAIATNGGSATAAALEMSNAVANGLDPAIADAFLTTVKNVKAEIGDIKDKSTGLSINIDAKSGELAQLQVKGFKIEWEDLQQSSSQKDFLIRVTRQEINVGLQAMVSAAQGTLKPPGEPDTKPAEDLAKANEEAQAEQQKADEAAAKADEERIAAMEKAYADEEEAMQKAMDAAQKAREEEIARVEKFYDDKIAAINKAEEARKKAFEEEKKRQEREKTWHQLQLDLMKAQAKGDTFGGLKAKMDMRAAQKGWKTDDADQAAGDKAKNKVDKLGKEKDTRTKKMKDASDKLGGADKDKLEALKKMHKAEVDAARKAAKDAADARKAALDQMTKDNKAAVDQQTADSKQAADDAAAEYSKKMDAIRVLMEKQGVSTKDKLAELAVITGQNLETVTSQFHDSLIKMGIGEDLYNSIMDPLSKLPLDTIAAAVAAALAGDKGNAQSLLNEAQKRVDEYNANKPPGVGAGGSDNNAAGDGQARPPGSAAEALVNGVKSVWHSVFGEADPSPQDKAPGWDGNRAEGGMIRGPGGPTSDSILAHLSNGEYVIRAAAVSKYGKHFLDSVNAKKFAAGGAVGKIAAKDATAGTAVPGAPTAAGKVEEALSDATQKLSDDRSAGDKKAIKTDKDLAAQKIKSTQDAFTNALDDATGLNVKQTAMENVLFQLKQTHIAALLTQTTNAETAMNAAIIYRKQLQMVSFNELQARNAALISDFNTQWATWKDNSISDIKAVADELGKSFANIDYGKIIDMVSAFATGDTAGTGAATQKELAKAEGGYVSGPGSGTSDSIPARLSNGEYVIKNSSVQRYGTSFLDKVNSGAIAANDTARFAEGGLVGQLGARVSTGLNEGAAAAVQKAIDAKNATLSAASGGTSTWNGVILTPEQVTKIKGQYKFADVLAGGSWSDTNGKQYQNGGGPHSVQTGPINLWSLPESAWGVNDIAAEDGTPIYAYADGTIIWARNGGGWDPGYVKQSINAFPGGEVLYGHTPPGGMSVKEGDSVKAGQVIARTGTSNNGFAHLHIEWHDVPTLTQRDAGGAVPWLAEGGFISPQLAAMVKSRKIGADPANWKLTPRQVVAASGVPGSSGPFNSVVPTGQMASDLWKWLIGQGLSEAGAAGVMGNLNQESTLDPSLMESGGTGIGLVQWSFGRADALRAFAESKGKPWQDLNTQLEFFLGEINSDATWSGMWNTLKTIQDVDEATALFHDTFEKSADRERGIYNERPADAHNFYNNFASGVKKADGGFISGPGTGTSDSIPARLSNGEYVVRQSSVAKYGTAFLDKLNQGQVGLAEPPAWAAGISTAIDGKVADFVRKQLNLTNLKRTIKIPEVEKAVAAAAGGVDGKAEIKDGLLYGVTSATIVEHAKKALGTPYSTEARAGGPGVGFDCSSFAYWAYEGYPGLMKNGWGPGVGWTGTLKDEGKPRDMAAIKAGDILLHNPDSTGGHAALYIGNGQIQHSANPNQIASVDVWGGFEQARQILAMAQGGLVIPALRRGATINYDNTLANLHKGEAVLTAPLTQKLNKGIDDLASGSHVAYNVSVNIDKANATPYEIEQAVYSALNKKEIRSGRSRVIGGRK